MKTHRTLTPEQETKRDARRAHFKVLLEHLKEMNDADRAKFSGMFVTNPEGHKLSPANTILINLQRPGCSIVAGFHQWRQYNLRVAKGERGITIWIPINAPKTEGDPIPDEIQFSTTTVFDISQTEENKETVPVERFAVSTPPSHMRNMDTVRLITPGRG
jgi:hypothetical protein